MHRRPLLTVNPSSAGGANLLNSRRMNEAEWQTCQQRTDTRLRAMWPATHADHLVKTCRTVFNQADDFVKKFTGNPNVDRPRGSLSASTGEWVRVRCRSGIRLTCFIREFRNRPSPKIVVTVEVPSPAGTGDVLRPSDGRSWKSRMREVTWPGEGRWANDIPALELIVPLRPVKSRTLSERMFGRGTRLCPDINKSKFVVFDCFDGTLNRYFRNVSTFDIKSPGRTPITLPEFIEKIWQNLDRNRYASERRLSPQNSY